MTFHKLELVAFTPSLLSFYSLHWGGENMDKLSSKFNSRHSDSLVLLVIASAGLKLKFPVLWVILCFHFPPHNHQHQVLLQCVSYPHQIMTTRRRTDQQMMGTTRIMMMTQEMVIFLLTLILSLLLLWWYKPGQNVHFWRRCIFLN